MENLKVLLIEDNVSDAFIMKFYLENSKHATYDVHHEEELEGGIAAAQANKYDIILLDLHFENIESLATLEKFQKEAPDNFVIVFTGFYDEEVGVESLKLGAQDYIVKGQQDNTVFNLKLKYAVERYKAQVKMLYVSAHLDQNVERFHIIQRIAGIGYFEFSDSESTVKLSTELAINRLNLEGKEVKHEAFFKLFEDKESIQNALKSKDKSIFKTKTYNGLNVEVTIDPNNPFFHRTAGIVKFLE
jgi:DNA-binding NarL/FixJ family response regulator